MRKTKLTFIITFSLLVLCGSLAQSAIVGSTDDPMSVGGGARPIGMGKAFVAVADNADTMFINPAGLASLKGPEAMAMFTNLLSEVYYMEYCGTVPTNFGTVGLGYISTGVNQIPTDSVFTDYYDSLFVLSYGTPLARFADYGKNLFVGLNYKIFSRGFTGGTNQHAAGMSADFGLKLVVNPFLSFGLCRQNFLPVSLGGVIRLSGGAEESLASIIKFGVAVKPVPLKRKLLIAFDVDLPAQSGRPVTAHLGTEWKMHKNLTLRAGLDQNLDPATATKTSLNPTYGISFQYAGFRVDHAYHAYYNDPALATTYVSLSYIGKPWFALKGELR